MHTKQRAVEFVNFWEKWFFFFFRILIDGRLEGRRTFVLRFTCNDVEGPFCVAWRTNLGESLLHVRILSAGFCWKQKNSTREITISARIYQETSILGSDRYTAGNLSRQRDVKRSNCTYVTRETRTCSHFGYYGSSVVWRATGRQYNRLRQLACARWVREFHWLPGFGKRRYSAALESRGRDVSTRERGANYEI